MQCAVLECRVFAGRAGNGFDEKPAMFEMYALATSITFCASDRRCSALGGYIASLTVTASRPDRSHSTNGRRFSGGPGPWVGQLTGATGTASVLVRYNPAAPSRTFTVDCPKKSRGPLSE